MMGKTKESTKKVSSKIRDAVENFLKFLGSLRESYVTQPPRKRCQRLNEDVPPAGERDESAEGFHRKARGQRVEGTGPLPATFATTLTIVSIRPAPDGEETQSQ